YSGATTGGGTGRCRCPMGQPRRHPDPGPLAAAALRAPTCGVAVHLDGAAAFHHRVGSRHRAGRGGGGRPPWPLAPGPPHPNPRPVPPPPGGPPPPRTRPPPALAPRP